MQQCRVLELCIQASFCSVPITVTNVVVDFCASKVKSLGIYTLHPKLLRSSRVGNL